MQRYILFIAIFIFHIQAVGAQAITQAAAQAIAQKIWTTIGQPGKCPTVKLTQDSRLATYRENIIRIDTQRVAKQLERGLHGSAKDALAAIIGHEIRHAIMGHDGTPFGCWDSISRKREIDADFHGLLYAYFAGYEQSITVFDQVFSLLIKDPALTCYPTIQQRKRSDDSLVQAAKRLIQVFETGNLLLLTAQEMKQKDGSMRCDDYGYARRCYRYVGQRLLATPEINYNIGLSFFLEGLYDLKDDRYIYPLEPSTFAALQRLGGSKYPPGDARLDSAAHYFALADRPDAAKEVGFWARLGLCSVQVAQGKLGAVEQIEQKLTALKKEHSNRAEIQMLEGIFRTARQQGDDQAKGLALFRKSMLSPDPLVSLQAKYNLTALKADYVDTSAGMPFCNPPISNNISNLADVEAVFPARDRNGRQGTIYLQNDAGPDLDFHVFPLPGSNLFLYFVEIWGADHAHTRRAFQQLPTCNCPGTFPAGQNATPVSRGYFHSGTNIVQYPHHANLGFSGCYRVLRP